MKNSIKRAQSRAGSSFAERENQRSLAGGESNFRPKVKQLRRKLMMTLVALLAVTTGAWADETPLLTINSRDYKSFKSGSKTFDDKVTVTFSNSVGNDGDEDGWYGARQSSLLTVAGINGYTITSCKFYTKNGTATTGYTVEGESPSVYLSGLVVYTDDSKSVSIGAKGVNKIEVYGTASSSGTTVALTRGTGDKFNEWTLTKKMPAGNVAVTAEYFPQATAAEGALTAATGVAATTSEPLVTLDASKLTGATKLMYFVNKSTDPAPAYDAQGWSDKVPTADSFTEAGGYNVYYYPLGTDDADPAKTFSDGDICATALTVTLAAAPTYSVTFAKDTPEPDKWAAEPNTGVKKGQTVTVTYSGQRKVIGVKAEKKAAPKLLEFAPGGVKFYYYEGETWGEAIRNHPENAANGWSIDEDDSYVMNNGTVLHENDNDDEIKSDMPVDPNIGYIW